MNIYIGLLVRYDDQCRRSKKNYLKIVSLIYDAQSYFIKIIESVKKKIIETFN